MKFKSIIIISLLLAILTIGAASAAEADMTSDNQTDFAEISEVENEIIIDDASEPMFDVSVPDEIRQGVPFEVTFTGADDLNGQIHVDYSGDDFNNDEYAQFSNGKAIMQLNIASTGLHRIPYEFSNDDYEICYSSSFDVNVSDLFDLELPDTVTAGRSFEVNFTTLKEVNGFIELVIFEEEGDYSEYAMIEDGKSLIFIECSICRQKLL